MTYAEALRHAVHAVINADLPLADTRTAVMNLIPKEHHVAHHQR
ncbi:hypothetical protein [Pseudarthrobacter cellobiosi]|nr:hypothetical protein [Pseudarthrobacter sp. HLT1-5]